MTQTKHTAGPWEVIGNLVRSPMHQPDGLPKGVLIAQCMDGYCQPFTEEAKANARLIAAAPELLDALIECLGCEFSVTEKSVIEKARAAIAKATGA